ncbi:hypothetical protein ACNOYE_14985 [Nannocystaceae bacterium ST9]
MFKSKFSRIALSLVLATTASVSLTACKKDGGGRKGKSERLRWVEKPTNGKSEDGGKLIKIAGIGVDFYVPDVLYVYRKCEEPGHVADGPEKKWIPVIRCEVAEGPIGGEEGGGDEEGGVESDWESSEEEDLDDEGGGAVDMTIYVTDKSDMIISERSVESYKLQYQNAGFKVVDIGYHDEYLAKPGRRGIEVVVQTIDTETGYPDREIRRFMFPKDDVVFIAHIDYPFGDDRSGIDSDWQRILWGFQFVEDGPLYGAE